MLSFPTIFSRTLAAFPLSGEAFLSFAPVLNSPDSLELQISEMEIISRSCRLSLALVVPRNVDDGRADNAMPIPLHCWIQRESVV